MSAFPKITLFILLSLLNFSTFAQKLSKADTETPYAKKKYLLKLPNEVVYNLAKKKFDQPNLNYWLQFAIDSVHYDSTFKNLPSNKNLYQLAVHHDNVAINLIKDKNWNIYMVNQHNQHGIKVFDFEGKEHTNAKITCNKTRLKYNSKLGIYVIKKAKNKATIVLEDGDHIEFFSLNFHKPRPLSKIYQAFSFQRFFSRTPKKDYNGFIAFSQPKYRPGDTLQIKAYVVDKKGRPIKKSITLKISTYHYANGYGTTLIPYEQLTAPTAPGNFVWQIPVSDTFLIDKSYTVELYDEKKQTQITENIYIEDYELDKTSYTLKSSSQNNTIKYGDKLSFLAQGTDANGNPVMDGTITLKATAYVSELYIRELFIPDTLWFHTQSLDPKGITTIAFPDSLLPNGVGSIYVNATFKNSNNELHESSLNLSFNMDAAKWLVTQSDSMHIAFLKNNAIEKGKLLLQRYNQNNALMDETWIENPSTLAYDALVKQYKLSTTDFSQTHSFFPTSPAHVEVEARRNKDTVAIEVLNPKKLDVLLSVYQNDKLLEVIKLNDTAYYKNISNSYGKDYYAKVSYLWNGIENYNYSETLYAKNALTVAFQHQNEVQPGEKDTITIAINDAKGQPVEGVNITASAYNAQFNQDKYPDLPYLGKDKRKFPDNKEYNINEKQHNYSFKLKATDLARLDLTNTYYYQMRFPNQARVEKYIALPVNQSQVSVYVHQNGKVRRYYYIQNQYQLLQHGWSDINEGAQLLGPGYWSLKVRLSDQILTIDSVRVLTNHLTVVSINLDYQEGSLHTSKMKKKLRKQEKTLIANSTLSIQNAGNWSYNWALITSDQLFGIPHYYSEQQYFKIGPIIPNTQLLLYDYSHNQKMPFEFIPGYAYSITGPSVIAKPFTLFKKKKVKLCKYLNFGGNYFNVASERPDYKKMVIDDVYYSNQLPYSGNCRIQFLSEKDFGVQKMIIEPIMTFPAWPYANGYCPNLPEGQVKFYLIKDSGKYHQTDYLLARKGGTLYYNIPDENDLPIVENNEKLMANFGKTNFPTYYQKNTKGTLLMHVVDKATNQPLPNINFILQNANNKTQYYPQSDAWGNIYLTLLPGTYSFSINEQGVYRTSFATITITATTCQFYEERCLVAPWYINYQMDENLFRGYINVGGRGDGNSYFNSGISLDKISIQSTRKGIFKSKANYAYDSDFKSDDRLEEKFNGTYQWSFGDSVVLPEPNGDLPTLRTNFKDNAYWQPTLYTNQNGKVTFGVTYPDDITTWKHYGAAFSDKKQTGLGFSSTKAYKKVVAELALPRFAIEGDEILAIGKAMNYTGTNTPVSLTFTTGDYKFVKDTLLSNIITQKLPLTIPTWQRDQKNILQPIFSLRLPNGYQDGEQRDLPIFPAGVERVKGFFTVLEKDTSFDIQALLDGEIIVHAENSSLDFLLQSLEDLKKYPYECNEQLASKMRAFLSQKKINAALNIPFEHDKTIKAFIKTLEKAQNTDGSWGWWPKARTDYYMTAYILQSLYLAELQGFSSDATAKAKALLRNTVNYMHHSQALFALEVLSSMKEPFDYITLLNAIARTDTSYSDKMTIELIKARQNLGINKTWIAAQRKESYLGNAFYPGEENKAWHSSLINTLKVYEINQLDNNSADNNVILRFFLEQKNGPYGWNNTIETAKIIETILPDFLQQKKAGRIANLQVTTSEGTKEVSFPYTFKTAANNPINVRYTGTEPVYFTAYQKQWLSKPASFTDHFVVSSEFVQDNKTVVQLETGKNATLKVTVQAKKFGEYLMLNIPIPAGCSYADKSQGYGPSEIHREYFKNEVAIFIENIGPGTYTYTVPLEVRYEGLQTLNPAKIELMYFPTFQGYNGLKKVEVLEGK
jgi:alpha-2-macroglobulin